MNRPNHHGAPLAALTIRVVLLSSLAFFLLPKWAPASQKRLVPAAEYHRYVDALLEVNDFGAHYYEDGAADASVLFPESPQAPYDYKRPPEPVIALIRLRERALPVLIDCLDDGRVAKIVFEGNKLTRPMNVPVGYVCLDVLMNVAMGKPVSDPECADDGLGACMNYGFYFRPDDYYDCSDRECVLRPWVFVVQRKWKEQFLAHRLRFRNPYNSLDVDEYKEFRTTTK